MDINIDWVSYWRRTRARGRLSFLLRRGTALGLIMFGLMVLIPRIFHMVEETSLPITQFVVFMVIGFVLSAGLWWANERSYKYARAKQAARRKRQLEETRDD